MPHPEDQLTPKVERLEQTVKQLTKVVGSQQELIVSLRNAHHQTVSAVKQLANNGRRRDVATVLASMEATPYSD